MRRLIVLGLATTLLLLAACGGTKPAPTPTPSSGVQGILLFVGGFSVGSPSPLPDGFGTTKDGRPYGPMPIQVKAKSGPKAGKVVAKVTNSRDGLFSVTLPPGTYVLTPLVPKNGPWPVPKTVVVIPGKYTRAIVYLEGR